MNCKHRGKIIYEIEWEWEKSQNFVSNGGEIKTTLPTTTDNTIK